MVRRIAAITPAKINLGLEVIGRRPDGYHEIVTILQAISLFDRLVWRESSGSFNYLSPPDIGAEHDLVSRALILAADSESWTGRLSLDKSIPEAAGLGGGSSDAALALKLSIPADNDEIMDQAARLGADVPFFISGGTAFARGTGVELSALPTPSLWVVLVVPEIAIPSKTRTLYESLGPDDFTDGSAVESIARNLASNDWSATSPPNAFTRSLMEFAPVRVATSALNSAGAPWVSVSGAGPTVFTLVARFTDAQLIARRVPPQVGRIILARTIPAARHHAAVSEMAQYIRGRHLSR